MSKLKQKLKISIEIEFEDMNDYQMHLSIIKARLNQYVKHGTESMKEGVEETGWSNHKYCIVPVGDNPDELQ